MSNASRLGVPGSSAVPVISSQSPRFSAAKLVNVFQRLAPGIALATAIAALSILIGQRLGGPVMLYALVVGMAFNFLATHERTAAGISYSANSILKIGVALLGVKITVVDVADLGFQTAGLVVIGVAATMVVGTWIGRMLGLKTAHSILSAGSVAICGSSAALAISSVLPQSRETERNTVFTVVIVTSLSTLAMVLYPALANLLNMNETSAGIFMGATIHNVAQVVGAGYMVSEGAGDTATIVKLMRVAFLLPVIVIIGLMFRDTGERAAGAKRPPMLPVFMIGFILIMLVNSFGLIPAAAASILAQASHWALVIAVAALGVKTSVTEIFSVGPKPILVLSLQTVFLAVLALSALTFILTV